jgi:hypothetical protein
MYSFRLNLTVAASFRLADKSANVGGLTSFLSQRRRERMDIMYFFAKKVSFIHLSLRPLRLCESLYL